MLEPQNITGADSISTPAPVLAWVDSVGCFLLLPGRRWRIGGPGGNPGAEVTICGDLSRRAGEILRRGSRYVLHGFSDGAGGVLRSDQPMELTGKMRFQLTPAIGLEFAQPHPLSASANLRVTTGHRTQPACDSLVLVADTCILGPSTSSHIVCPDASAAIVLLVGEDGRWRVKGSDLLRVDGEPVQGVTPLNLPCRIEAGETVIALEPVAR